MDDTKLLNIGKGGVTENTISSAREILNKYKKIKIKIINPDLRDEKKEIFEQIAKETKSKVLKIIGFTCVLSKR